MKNDSMNNMMDEIKLVNYLSGELDTVEAKEVERWLEDPENKAEFEKLTQLWEGTANLRNAELFTAEKSWNGLKQRMDHHDTKGVRERNITIFRYAIAASMVIILGIAVFFYMQGRNHIQFNAGNIKSEKPVILPDGTSVYLNRNTYLSYAKDFNSKTRTVTLTGEAFFDVAKNPSKPFIIKTTTTEIRVVGTSFNVMAYTGSDSVQVSVQSGIVEMYPKADEESRIRLVIGNEGTFVKSQKKLLSRKTFDSNLLAWKTNQLNFRSAPMDYVANSLKRAFGKEIKFESANFKNCRLTVNFNNQSLDTILKVIKETFGVTVSNQGDVYILSGPGC